MRRIQLVLLSIALLISLLGITAFSEVRSASASQKSLYANTTQKSLPQAPCSGNGCDGLDPAAVGCSADAYTVQTAVFGNSYVELRYSPMCGANWGRVTSRVGLTSLVIRTQRLSDGLTYTFSGGNYYYAWSAMVYAPTTPARACGGVNGISGCTAYV
jgi:Protein of unknown function (DUF2690)